MALQDQVGMTGPSYEVDIERGKIREFARAMAAPLPEFLEGHDPVIPAMFLVSAPYTWGYTLERPRGTNFADIEFDPKVSLHGEESFIFHGAIPKAGDRLIATPCLENVNQKQGSSGGAMTILTVLVQYHDLEGTLRVEQRSTSITTEDTPGSENWQVELPDYEPAYLSLEPRSPFTNIRRCNFEDLIEGEGPGPISAGPLLKQDIIRFQGVVGEDDPLHHDMEWAKAHDYPQVFGLGTHQASLMCAYVAHWLPPETVRSFKVRFGVITWPGDRLVYDAKVTKLDPDTRCAELHLTSTRENGELVNQAWMECDFNEQ